MKPYGEKTKCRCCTPPKPNRAGKRRARAEGKREATEYLEPAPDITPAELQDLRCTCQCCLAFMGEAECDCDYHRGRRDD